jgi:hypothetical protein
VNVFWYVVKTSTVGLLSYCSQKGRTCRVTVVDAKGTRHTAKVVAKSLYEAALAGLKTIREGWRRTGTGNADPVSIVPPEHTSSHFGTFGRGWRRFRGITKDMALKHCLRVEPAVVFIWSFQ